jgi:hypothetical protein
LPPLADFTDVLKRLLKSTRILERYWRRRDSVPAADAMGCSRGLHIGGSVISLIEDCLASSDARPSFAAFDIEAAVP